jgi:hypothetical protein
MNIMTKPAWEELSDPHRDAWIQRAINFYPPGSVAMPELIEVARDEYAESDSLLPVVELPDPNQAWLG